MTYVLILFIIRQYRGRRSIFLVFVFLLKNRRIKEDAFVLLCDLEFLLFVV